MHQWRETIRRLMGRAPRYEVLLSVAGADVSHATDLAQALAAHNLRVFYYLHPAIAGALWAQNLLQLLPSLYRSGYFCVVFISSRYLSSPWTQVELDSALKRHHREEFILPVLIEAGAHVFGISPLDIFKTIPPASPADLAEMIARKVDRKRGAALRRRRLAGAMALLFTGALALTWPVPSGNYTARLAPIREVTLEGVVEPTSLQVAAVPMTATFTLVQTGPGARACGAPTIEGTIRQADLVPGTADGGCKQLIVSTHGTGGVVIQAKAGCELDVRLRFSTKTPVICDGRTIVQVEALSVVLGPDESVRLVRRRIETSDGADQAPPLEPWLVEWGVTRLSATYAGDVTLGQDCPVHAGDIVRLAGKPVTLALLARDRAHHPYLGAVVRAAEAGPPQVGAGPPETRSWTDCVVGPSRPLWGAIWRWVVPRRS